MCKKLLNVDFATDSKLQTIETNLFCDSALESISIPCSVTQINENAFYNCKKLRNIKIPINSILQSINENAFTGSAITSLFIPQNIIKICPNQGWSTLSVDSLNCKQYRSFTGQRQRRYVR